MGAHTLGGDLTQKTNVAPASSLRNLEENNVNRILQRGPRPNINTVVSVLNNNGIDISGNGGKTPPSSGTCKRAGAPINTLENGTWFDTTPLKFDNNYFI